MGAQVARHPETGLLAVEPLGELTEYQACTRIPEVRRALGNDVLILGHHYQRDEVIRFADRTGDSLELAREAARNGDAKAIVFCGVHFMAETAVILSAPDRAVILPDATAGCSMADMAEPDQVALAWEELADALTGSVGDPAAEVMPVAYVNSTAAVKAFVGERGGSICTSANAAAVFDWALSQRPRLFFLPDQHLGRNTAVLRGIPASETLVWDPAKPFGGNTAEAVRSARIYLWQGHCQVHTRFRVEQIEAYRKAVPDVRILVHPECPLEVVQAADHVGSTGYIIRTIREAPAGSKWAVGTEIHLVERLRTAHPDKTIASLLPGISLCSTMNRIDPQHLLHALERISAGEPVGKVSVPETVAHKARLALDRMLSIS